MNYKFYSPQRVCTDCGKPGYVIVCADGKNRCSNCRIAHIRKSYEEFRKSVVKKEKTDE